LCVTNCRLTDTQSTASSAGEYEPNPNVYELSDLDLESEVC